MTKINLSGHPNPALEAQGFTFPGILHVDVNDPELPNKLVAFLKPLVGEGKEQVTIAPPGLAPLALLTTSIIHGLTGSFPILQTLVKGETGFVPGPCFDLQAIRNEHGRAGRDHVVDFSKTDPSFSPDIGPDIG